jgi:hypothetical protein
MTVYYELLDKGPPSRRRLVFFAIVSVFLTLLAIANLSAYKVYIKEGNKSKDNSAQYKFSVDEDLNEIAGGVSSTRVLHMDVLIVDVDPIKQQIRLNVKLTRVGAFEFTNATAPTMLLGSFKSIPVTFNSFFMDVESVVQVDGDINRYPFDNYSADIPFTATMGDVLVLGQDAKMLDFSMNAYGAIQNWRFEMAFEKSPTLPVILLELKIKRSPTTKGFSMFIIIIMWLLSLAAVAVTFQVVVRQRDAAPPLLGMLVSLLFAMPAVRNTQPNVPPIGTLADVVGLFFNMFLVALSSILAMWSWVMQGKWPEPPKTTVTDKA